MNLPGFRLERQRILSEASGFEEVFSRTDSP